jgi:hypothetical protein
MFLVAAVNKLRDVMQEDHAGRVRERIAEIHQACIDSIQRHDATGLEKAMRKLWQITDQAIRDSIDWRIQAESLESELLTYRPRLVDRPAAPRLRGHFYVYTAKFPWVCAAVAHREKFYHALLRQEQEYYIWDKKTLCGKASMFSVEDRFTSGGWPRRHELCRACVELLTQTPLERDLFLIVDRDRVL